MKNQLHKQQKLNIDDCPHLKRLETITKYDGDESYDIECCGQCGEEMTPTMLEVRKERLKKYNIFE